MDRSAGWCPPPRRSGRVAEAYLVTARGFRVCRGRCLCVGRVLRTSLHRCRLGVRRSAREPVNLRHAENNITACGERSPMRGPRLAKVFHTRVCHTLGRRRREQNTVSTTLGSSRRSFLITPMPNMGKMAVGIAALVVVLCPPCFANHEDDKKLQTVLCSSSEWSLSETLVTAPLFGSYNVTSTSSLLSRFIPVAGTLKVSGLCSPKVFSTPFRRFAHSSPDVKSMSLHLNNQSTLAAMTMITVT